MTVMRLTLDTNLLVYAHDRNAGPKHHEAVALIHRVQNADCILTLQALAELYKWLITKGKPPPTSAADSIGDWMASFPVQAADRGCLLDAMAGVADHGFSFRDAMIWATARQAGCRLLLSEDGHHGGQYGGVLILNPFHLDAVPILAQALTDR